MNIRSGTEVESIAAHRAGLGAIAEAGTNRLPMLLRVPDGGPAYGMRVRLDPRCSRTAREPARSIDTFHPAVAQARVGPRDFAGHAVRGDAYWRCLRRSSQSGVMAISFDERPYWSATARRRSSPRPRVKRWPSGSRTTKSRMPYGREATGSTISAPAWQYSSQSWSGSST